MTNIPRKYKVKLNSVEKIEELLQESYNQSCQQINVIQDEMNKLANSTVLSNETADVRLKYAKAMNDFIMNKDKAIGRKLEIAKFMGEVLKHNGDVNKAVNENESNINYNSLDIEEIKKVISSMENNDKEQYKLYS